MSAPLFSQVYAFCPEQDLKQKVLLAMASMANAKDGNAIWFRIDTLTLMTRSSERRVVSTVKDLVRAGRLACEAGAGPHGYDRYTIVVPSEKVTWESIKAARAAHPQVVADAARYSKRRSKDPRQVKHAPARFSAPGVTAPVVPAVTVTPDISCEAPAAAFLTAAPPEMSTELHGMTTDLHEMSISNPAPLRLTTENPLPNSSFNSSVNEVVIELDTNPGAREDLAALQAMLNEAELEDDDSEPMIEPQKPNLTLETWANEDDLLLGLTPDGAAPDGTEEGEPQDVPEPGASVGDDVQPTAFEQVPPWRRGPGERNAPGSEAYRVLSALAGGPSRAPHLPTLLREEGTNGIERVHWLALHLDEIAEAKVDARKRHADGAGAFRTLLFGNFDNLALTGSIRAPAVTFRGAGGGYNGHAAVHLPGQGATGDDVYNAPFPEGSRVKLDREWLGTVHAISRGLDRTLDIDLDAGRRVCVPLHELARLQAVEDAPAAPEYVSEFAPGQVWVHKTSGERLSVAGKALGSVTLSDGRTLNMMELTKGYAHAQD